MRVQRVVEAALLLAAFFTGDVRFAYATLASATLQAMSPRLAPVALLVATLVPAHDEHRLGDFYFDLRASQGACASSAVL